MAGLHSDVRAAHGRGMSRLVLRRSYPWAWNELQRLDDERKRYFGERFETYRKLARHGKLTAARVVKCDLGRDAKNPVVFWYEEQLAEFKVKAYCEYARRIQSFRDIITLRLDNLANRIQLSWWNHKMKAAALDLICLDVLGRIGLNVSRRSNVDRVHFGYGEGITAIMVKRYYDCARHIRKLRDLLGKSAKKIQSSWRDHVLHHEIKAAAAAFIRLIKMI